MPSKDQKLLYQLEFEDEQLLFAKVSVSGVTTVPTKEEAEVRFMSLLALYSLRTVFCCTWAELKQNCCFVASEVALFRNGILILSLKPRFSLPLDDVVLYFW